MEETTIWDWQFGLNSEVVIILSGLDRKILLYVHLRGSNSAMFFLSAFSVGIYSWKQEFALGGANSCL